MKTFKQGLLFGGLLTSLFPSCGLAFVNPKNALFSPSYYAGIGLGGINGQFNTTSLTQINPSYSFFANQSIDPKTTDNQLLGTFYLGKLFALNHFYIGPEVYANIGTPSSGWGESAQLLFPNESLSTSVNSQLNTVDLGIDARVGTLINIGSLLYGRIGLSWNKISNNILVIDTRPTIPLTTTINSSWDRHYTGFRAGLGFEQTITTTWSIRGDYVFTHYPSVSNSISSVSDSVSILQLGPVTNTTKIQVNTQAVFVSLAYHWKTLYEK